MKLSHGSRREDIHVICSGMEPFLADGHFLRRANMPAPEV